MVLGAGLAGCDAALTGSEIDRTAGGRARRTASSLSRVDPTGAHQAGITRPESAPAHLVAEVFDLAGDPRRVLGALGAAVLRLTAGDHAALAGIDPGDLTVTVGVGPALVAATVPGLGDLTLPAYPFEDIAPGDRGGDVLVQVAASDPLVLPLALTALEDAAGGALRPRWRQRASRGPEVRVAGSATAPRNVLGFVDGIAAPRSEADLAASVWIDEGPARGGTIAVVRRMAIDVRGFQRLAVADQEAAIGRERGSGAPLSGGSIDADVDLGAKSPDGRYLVPADAHARRAHPSAVGVPLMLRRSYSMDDPPGLLFVSFQNQLRSFTATMARMAESDALLTRTTTTASASFLVLPGFDARAPLGSGVFG